MIGNIPLILGMSPSPAAKHGQRAFAREANTTRRLARFVGLKDPSLLFETFDCANLDELRQDDTGRIFIDFKEAGRTLDLLNALGQLEERVVIALGEQVCAALAAWFQVTAFARPSLTEVEHPREYWRCTICAIDHPRSYRRTRAERWLKNAAILKNALAINPGPTQAAMRRAHEADLREQASLSDLIAAFERETEEKISEQDSDAWEAERREWRHLRDYYSTPPYNPADYD